MGKGLNKGHKTFPNRRNSDSSMDEDSSSSEATHNSDLEAQQEQERLVDLVNITKRMNYLAKKKAELQGPIQELR